MNDYIINVEDLMGFSPEPVLSERTIGESEDYVEGLVRGLQLAYPKHRVTKEQIPK